MKWDELNCFSASNMLWPVAIERGIQIEKAREGGETSNEVLRKIAEAKEICIWGLGRYFGEDFFQNGWNEILMPKYFTDVNITEAMRNQLQEKCVEVENVINILNREGLLVIIYVRDTAAIEEVLNEHGIDYLRIQDIYNM